MRTKGKITSWNDGKGYGFISPVSGGKQVFVHINAFSNRNRRPEIGQVVTYGISSDKQGRPCAVKATLAGDRLQQNEKNSIESISIATAGIFIGIVAFSVVGGNLPPVVLIIYVGLSILTFFAYALDKAAATKGSWRTQESTLHLFALLGGWPGALVAQQKLRHKSKKASFRTVFWVTVVFNCCAFVWLFSSAGAALVNSFL
jgi:uncharacterized membrane protein YsdA (DUF1294 family)/cold shock CspA family protein